MQDTDWKFSEERIPREAIFGLDTPPTPPFDYDDVRRSVYWERRITTVKTEREIRLRCLQGWFFRASWSEKFSFITELCDLTDGISVLERVLKCVDGIYSKDVIDSFARDRILFPYDIVPTDDDRAMTPGELREVRQEDTMWFLTLDAESQVEVIVKLLKLGGGGLIFNAYKEIDRMYKERKEISMILTAVDASIRELVEDRRSRNEGNPRKGGEDSDGNKYTVRKYEQIVRRNTELNEFRRKYGLGNGRKREMGEVVDYIQVLPIWLNRKIMLYLNERDLAELKQTGKYWTKMIEDALRESTGRAAIDAKIGRMRGYGAERQESIEESEDVTELGKDALLTELHLRQRDVVRARKESKTMREAKLETSVWEEMCFERIVCCGNNTCKVFAASTPNKTIVFYSLRTGMKMRNVVSGVPCQVTAMSIHDEGFHVVVGCEDGSLLTVNMRKNKRTMRYNGHSGPVLRVHVSDDKLVSAAEDRTIKLFDLWSGLCLSCVNIDDSIKCMTVQERDIEPRRAVAGTAQGKLVFIDLGKKKIYREVVVHKSDVMGIKVEGKIAVTHSADRNVRLWSFNHLEVGKCGVRPFWSIRLKSVATAVECHGNEIFAACADGRLRLICKLTGDATRVVEVTQKKPIAGIYVMQEKDTTKMIMWHEGGIEMRSFSTAKVARKKKKPTARKDDVVALSRRRLFSVVPTGAVHLTLPRGAIVKRYKPTNVEDRERVAADRSCTVKELRNIAANEIETISRDVFTQMIKAFHIPKDGQLVTFSRLQRKGASSAVNITSNKTDDSSTYDSIDRISTKHAEVS